MNNYSVTFDIRYDQGKVKVDYTCVPVEKIDETTYRSLATTSNFYFTELKKRKNYLCRYWKTKKQVYFCGVFQSELDSIEFEKTNLLNIAKEVSRLMPFRRGFKSALFSRVERILN